MGFAWQVPISDGRIEAWALVALDQRPFTWLNWSNDLRTTATRAKVRCSSEWRTEVEHILLQLSWEVLNAT